MNPNRPKTREFRIRVPLSTKARRNLPRFGEAKEGEENVTLRSTDFIAMEHPDDQLQEDGDDVFGKTLLATISKNLSAASAGDFSREEPEEETPLPSEKPSSSSRYVPPGQRGATSGSTEREGTENTLRVSNLSKATTEDDLQELFGRFGRIHRLSLPKTEDKFGDKVPRGFAYIAFVRRQDAEAAMESLQGYGYDHLIIKIEWAKPNDGPPVQQNVYRSGYGQRLAQDTTEKAVFTSTKG